MPKVFISYRFHEADKAVAEQFAQGLRTQEMDIFLAHDSIKIGQKWAETIDQNLRACDYFMILLSDHAVQSEMVIQEIETARRFHEQSQGERPLFLPIYLNNLDQDLIPYDVRGYLNRFQYKLWNSEADTDPILKEISEVIKSGQHLERDLQDEEEELPAKARTKEQAPLVSAPLELPDTISLNSPFYIARHGEDHIVNSILKPGAVLRIKGPHKYGKTSLLSRIIAKAKEAKYKVVPISFTGLNLETLTDLESLLRHLCIYTARKLRIRDNELEEYWDIKGLDLKTRCSGYFSDFLLDKTDEPVVLVLDNADRLFEFPAVSGEFFSLLRTWHEDAALDPVWQQLRLVVSHSTEAYLAIENMNQSPFNVGHAVNLEPFDEEEVTQLVQRHGLAWDTGQVKTLMEMVGGHPYLL
ncbi:MAG TPA: molecular chaperone Tir, partial [Cytophagales bacterium]|nr:molecular chaperone Tir [Cytophagales bacterium]